MATNINHGHPHHGGAGGGGMAGDSQVNQLNGNGNGMYQAYEPRLKSMSPQESDHHQIQQQLQNAQPYSNGTSQHQPYHHLQQQSQQQQQHQQHQQIAYHHPSPPLNGGYQGQQQGQHLNQQQQQPQNVALSNGSSAASSNRTGTPTPRAAGEKKSRLRKACDACSERKVKCDNNKICEQCKNHNLPCTRNRESKPRGPPNKSVQEIKRKSALGETQKQMDLMPPGSYSSAGSPTAFGSPAYSLDSILPMDVLELLVDDFFTYIHPLAPMPHEPSFRMTFRNFQPDHHNAAAFLALVASMVAALVASFPRRPQKHLKAHNVGHLFPSSLDLISHCEKLASHARGVGFPRNQDLNVYHAITSYFLGLAHAYTLQWSHARLYFGETMNILRAVTTKMQRTGPPQDGPEPNVIEQELWKRVFWLNVVGARSLLQLGANMEELFIAPSTVTRYPPYPTVVDDKYIGPDGIMPMPEGETSQLTAFVLNIKIYDTLSPILVSEIAHGLNEVYDWGKQKLMLETALATVRDILKSLPPELVLNTDMIKSPSPLTGPHYQPTMTPYAMSEASVPYETSEEARLKTQYEIQKANLYVSQSGTRSYLVEKYEIMREQYCRRSQLDPDSPSQTDQIDVGIAAEREDIVKELLKVLGSIRQVDMEPSGHSLINKIRQVASTLVGAPEHRQGPAALKAREDLKIFLEILMNLEKVVPQDDLVEEELRYWADLRELQKKFAEAGGFTNNLA